MVLNDRDIRNNPTNILTGFFFSVYKEHYHSNVFPNSPGFQNGRRIISSESHSIAKKSDAYAKTYREAK
jgi:hypothetical protein